MSAIRLISLNRARPGQVAKISIPGVPDLKLANFSRRNYKKIEKRNNQSGTAEQLGCAACLKAHTRVKVVYRESSTYIVRIRIKTHALPFLSQK